jgi:excisionase family DNA binding protein
MAGRLLTIAAAARYLGCHRCTVYELIAVGRLRRVPFGRRLKVRLADLEALVEKGWRKNKPA